jgi:DNA polymerase-3 subunit alpha
MSKFSHLHVHSKFSILDGASDIKDMFKKAVKDGMPGIALTDHGNMFGAFKFVAEAEKYNIKGQPPTIKPVVGCEFYLVEDRFKKQFSREIKDVRYHQLLLAKNAMGYSNLVKLCSLGYIDGLYGKYPRIDRELILQYHDGLIATTCCLAAEVPRTIINKGETEAEKVFKWWLDIFGEDYYVELQRHGIADQNKVNEVLVRFAKKYGVKTIATNDSHYVEQDFYEAHDILLCVNTGELKSTPTVKDYDDEETSGKGKRFAFYNDQFYFKSTAEMSETFRDLPESIDNTNEIIDKVELLNLKKDIMLPHFALPGGKTDQFEYLYEKTFEGAKSKYGSLTPEITDRIHFELETIKKMGFTGYFLIVADFITAGRDLGVFVGPGRGSAAGSVVAYCIGITNIDPIKYNLLFERFLNPERKSMPDIDTDFDDEGRQKVIDYVVEKYGRNQVAQIVTFGSMAAKSSIKDVARVLDLPLSDSNALAKLVPDKPGTELARIMSAPIAGKDGLVEKDQYNNEDIDAIKKLREISEGNDLRAEVLKEAVKLEGSVRSTGMHAAGIIIAPTDIKNIIPVLTSKETNLLITQFEGKEIEEAGVIKMDFLGLKTLSILRDALNLIEANYKIRIDLDNIPLDDKETFELYQKGETNGTFQFESLGMQKHLRELKPDKFEDLIAMNALYRPGPMDNIPKFINRKFGREKVVYDTPEMEDLLKETYGITVYQEQVMLLSQRLAGFSKGDADTLRKAIGKKNQEALAKNKAKFVDGCVNNGISGEIANNIWADWESFASYAFNKSHSTCYAFVAFQTAYLKAHYPAEYMAAVLTHSLNDQKKLVFFIEETKRMGIPVLGPNVNESGYQFTVNSKKEIRFGIGGLKGIGENAVAALIEERNSNGPYKNIFDLTRRVNLRTVNRKSLEVLAKAGAFDDFPNSHRAQYFHKETPDGLIFLEKVIKNAIDYQNHKMGAQVSLFGGVSEVEMPEIQLPACEEWSTTIKLELEKEVAGFYISGHPLNDFNLEIQSFCTGTVNDLLFENSKANLGKPLAIAGMITKPEHLISKNNKQYGRFNLEDWGDTAQLVVFSEDYLRIKHLLVEGTTVLVKGTFQQRFKEAEKLDFKIASMTLLSEVLEKQTKKILVKLSSYAVNEDLINRFKNSITANRGSIPLTYEIIDESEKVTVRFVSKVPVSPQFALDVQKNINEVEVVIS